MTNNPAWRIRDPRGREPGANAKFYGYKSRFGDGHPNRRQCTATARSTGKQCRNDALQGAPTCRLHGGHVHAYRTAVRKFGPRVIPLRTGTSVPRIALATVGTSEPYPKGIPWHPSPIMRGRVIEAERNKFMDPKGWLSITKELTEQILKPPRRR